MGKPGWRSLGGITRTTGPTSSNCSSSSPWPRTVESRSTSRPRAATWSTTGPIAPPGTCSASSPDGATSSTWPTASWPPPRTWPTCTAMAAGFSPYCPVPGPRTASSARRWPEAGSEWRWVHDKYDEEGKLVDRYRVSEPAATSAEGYRLEWYHSTRKAELDALAPHAATRADLEGSGRAPAEADFATDTLPPAGQGDRGGGDDPPSPRDDGLD